jgi:hypothetical protein
MKKAQAAKILAGKEKGDKAAASRALRGGKARGGSKTKSTKRDK